MKRSPLSFLSPVLAFVALTCVAPFGGVAQALPAGDAVASAPKLGRGINLGNSLESPKEGEWGVTLKEKDFAIIAQAGFVTVRVPICWSAHASREAPYVIDPVFMRRVDWVVAQAKAHGLNAILDLHNYNELTKIPEQEEDRFVALWRQIAEHYQKEPPSILFELLNEPNKKLDADRWNALLVKALAAIRPTNPSRFVVIGPVQWNSIGKLPDLILPEDDRHLLATVHFYDPMPLTHQGAEWVSGSAKWMGTSWKGTDTEKQDLEKRLDQAAAWGKVHQRPIFLGEFGAYSKADMNSRQLWTAFVARAAEARGMAWAYWEFRSGFGAYDPATAQWRAPLLQALMPK